MIHHSHPSKLSTLHHTNQSEQIDLPPDIDFLDTVPSVVVGRSLSLAGINMGDVLSPN